MTEDPAATADQRPAPPVTADMIRRILLGMEDAEIRYRFLLDYNDQLENFVGHMVNAFLAWERLDARITKDEPSAHLTALVYGALHTHLVAMKLLLEGLLVPSGNSQRYVLESIATALLLSRPSLGYLDRYVKNTYSTTKAIRDVTKHAKTLGLEKSALATLSQRSKLYDLCSHPTQFASASLLTLQAENPQTVLGGHFDEGKALAYDNEISSRTSLAGLFPNIIYAVGRNYLDPA
ncbi:hypothetical protein [Luteimonas kalidii]|uniref:Uncharacterized protein n=1 Tax=Luteimonas kalidii TaxID=3042025 RepID=A0ABT6JXD7_9GAMM|nr:hypothetical protein [Luteimonas kalidii]MDH5835360.1 hypothetical protein [Luteimonas kalidii]